MPLPTKLPDGLPGAAPTGGTDNPASDIYNTPGGGATPTTPGRHNHFGGPPRPPLTIEGVMIEDGHGALKAEYQLVEHLYRISRTGDPESLRALYRRLLDHPLDHSAIKNRLIARWKKALYENEQKELQRIWPDDMIAKFFAQFEARAELTKWQPGETAN
jgi:hypothetical protein